MSDVHGKIIDFSTELQNKRFRRKAREDKINDLISGAAKGRNGKRQRVILKQSIVCQGNNTVNGDVIVNAHGPSYILPSHLTTDELKAIQDLVHALAGLEILAKKNRIASPRGISLHPQATTAGPAVWKRFNAQFRLSKYEALPKDKYEEAMKFLLGWKTELENLLAKGKQGKGRRNKRARVYQADIRPA